MKKIDLHSHTLISDGTLTPNDLVERAKAKGVEYQETRQGKGSHSRVYYGQKFTTVKQGGEIGGGLLGAMCTQLGIDKKDL